MDTIVNVELPLPMDVTGTLMRAVGSAYPNAHIVQDGSGRFLSFAISEEDRAASDGEVEEFEKADRDADVDALVTSFKDGTLGMSTEEWFSKMMVGALEDILEDTTAENYLEMTLTTSEGKGYAVVVCRTPDSTPHRLRQAAEKRAELYAETLRQLGVDPDAL